MGYYRENPRKVKFSALFSSKADEWETPKDFFAELDKEFKFDLDPCATVENSKCPNFFTKSDDGLILPWFGNVFVNPPYGKEVKYWVEKCWREVECGNANVVVALVAARTDTRWFHEYVSKASEIWLLQGRLVFEGAKFGAPFPSMVVVWRGMGNGSAAE